MKNFLVFGGSSFIGRHFLKRVSNFDLVHNQNIYDLIHPSINRDYKYIIIFNTFTRAGGFIDKNKLEVWEKNYLLHLKIFEYLKNINFENVISFGTSVGYSEDNYNEDFYLSGIPKNIYKPYAINKKNLYYSIEFLKEKKNFNHYHIIPSTIFGEDYHTDGRNLHFIYDIIVKLIKFKKQKNLPEFYGTGLEERELIYVNDFLNILFLIINKNEGIYNVSNPNSFTIAELVKIICDLLEIDYDHQNFFHKKKAIGSFSKSLDMKKTLNVIQNYQYERLELSIKNTIDWVYKSKIYEKY